MASFVADRERARPGREPLNAKARRSQGAKGGSVRGGVVRGKRQESVGLEGRAYHRGTEDTENGSGQTAHASWNRFLARRPEGRDREEGRPTQESRERVPSGNSTQRRRGAETQRGVRPGAWRRSWRTGRGRGLEGNRSTQRREEARAQREGAGGGVSSEGGGRKVSALKAGLTAEAQRTQRTAADKPPMLRRTDFSFLAQRREDAKGGTGRRGVVRGRRQESAGLVKAGLITEGTRKRRWQRVGWSPARRQDGDL